MSNLRTQSVVLHTRVCRVFLAIAVCGLAGVAIAATSFDDQRQAVSVSPATQSEAAILSLLEAGLAENKPSQAIAVTQQWLRGNVAENPLLLYHAGRAAELSGDWKAAAALYRQYLKRADLTSTTASDAILGVYTLLINQRADSESAYAYSRGEGHRLVVNAQARQFDRWFLDEAKRRKDHEAVALRLLALAQAKVSSDLLVALHESDFGWLLDTINDGRLDQTRYTPRFIQAVKDLSKAATFDKELSLLLDWSVSVKVYNRAILEGEQAAPPIAQAQALLSAYPRHAERVQTGWAGSRGRHYRGDPKKYWPLELEAKLAPVNAAVARLDALGKAEYYQSYGTHYYAGYPQLLNIEQARAWVLANPKLANSKTAPVLSFDWSNIKLEDAKKLAPHLANNPSPEAAGIRAIAAVNDEAKELDKAVDTLLKNEAWRLTPNELPGYIDRLWHRAGRPDGNGRRDQLIARGKPLQEQYNKSLLKKEDPANKRLAEFKRLWQDYRSNQPKIPGVRTRLMQALQFTPEAMAELLRDPSIEAQMIAQQAIDTSFISNDAKLQELFRYARLSTKSYNPSVRIIAARHGGYDQLKSRVPELYKPHPLLAELEKALSEQLKKDQAEPWLVMAWINATFIEKSDASVKLMADLLKSPVWKTMPYDVRRAARDWFPQTALTPAQLAYVTASDVDLICKPLVELPEDADADATAAALKTVLEGLKQSPVRHEILGLKRLAGKGEKKESLVDEPQVLEQLYELAGPMRSFTTDHSVAYRLYAIVSESKDPAVLHRLASYLWRDVELHHRLLPQMIAFADSLAAEHPSAASTMARTGLQTIARHSRGHTYFKRDTDIPRLRSIRGKAALAMGLIDIPVPPSHPAFAIYKSQAEFAIGNEDSARELYTDHADQLLPVHRDLSVSYLLWVLQHTIDARDDVRQEAIVKALLAWVAESSTAFSPEQRIALDIAYGDIALQRGMLPEAHKIFARIQTNAAYETIFTRHDATLRRVMVERISKDFDAALQTLMQLEAEKIPRLNTAAQFARAEVYYDMEEYQDAADAIAKVLEREPDHPDATLLRGRVQLKLQKLIEATEVELGSATKQASIVPGEMLKVTLNDPTLSVASGGSDIEVVVWATSGDKEHLLLRQFGDQKTKYRGEVRTALGKPNPDDRTLQIVGDDEIFYAYSERFRKKAVNLEENRGGPIIVASDAVMMASARKLLTEAEQRVIDMAAVTAVLEKRNTTAELATPEQLAQLKAEAAAAARSRMIQTRAKPGNPIHVRVIDPDRGRTAEIDELAVSVIASSGDVIGRVVLKETDTHSGYFEGSIPTAGAQAIAFGSTSETGLNPNMVISPKDTYGAWRPVASKDAKHAFTVDLNDNANLGQMTITAKEPGAKLKKFIVQTGMNAHDMTTVAIYPKNQIAIEKPWHPSVVVMNDTDHHQTRNDRTVYDLVELAEHVDRGWLLQQFPQGIAHNVAGPSEAMAETIPGDIQWKRHGRHHTSHVIYRFRGYFYEPAEVTRRFRLDLGRHTISEKIHSSVNHPAQFTLAIDGRRITGEDGQLDGKLRLSPGVHRFEIWATGWNSSIGFGRSIKLRANLDDEDTLVDCPDSFFDPASFPEGTIDHRNAPAQIAMKGDGGTFDVKFALDSRARLIRIVFGEQESPVPALNRIALTQPDGKRLLPVAQDYAELRKNDQLEMLTGDKITVRYVDDRYVTKGKQKHERFLDVAFTDAKVEFADIEPRFSSRHQQKRPYHEALLRFVHDKPLSIVVRDADMDTSVEPDTVTVTVRSEEGEPRKLIAQETGPSTGTFRAWVTPVAGTAPDAKHIQVAEGGTLTVTYRDAENLRPGVPYDRTATIRHASFAVPQIEIAHATLTPLEPEWEGGKQRLYESLEPRHLAAKSGRRAAIDELIQPRFRIDRRFVGRGDAPDGGVAVVYGRHASVEIVAPHLALGDASSVEVYAQTDAGRALRANDAGGKGDAAPFDIDVPGTIRLVGLIGTTPPGSRALERGGYVSGGIAGRGNAYEQTALSRREGRFRVVLPLIPGPLPERSLADPEELHELRIPQPYGLTAKAGERVHVGVAYTDRAGKRQWVTGSAKVIARPMLDVMQEDYRHTMNKAYVGERVHLRVVDPARDRTADRDEVRVYMASKSGAKHHVTLRETAQNTGIFKGSYQLTYAASKDAAADTGEAGAYDVKRSGFPVVYGDAVGVRYTDASGEKTPVHYVTIGKGSDGSIAPFSKQYDDSETAMHTQFAMAESFLELARRHRKTGEEQQAVREFTRAKQLLANAITQFNDPETRAHAEYLLGNLTMEDAEATENPELQADRYRAGLARFMKVTGTYPDTEYASKAQFKIAVVYERLSEPDIAAQEYVKLAYKYPESEHLATAMARLGTHFQRKAIGFEKEAEPLLAKEDDKDAQHEGIALQKLSRLEYIKSAQIFERLQTRFPEHELAGKAGLRAGQIYMRAEDYRSAVKALQSVIDNEGYDGATLRSEAMYWAGRCYESLNQQLQAYALFKRITYDFPESKWAAYSRAQLSTERMLMLDRKLEIERLEEGQ